MDANSVCIGSIGSDGGVSFGGVTREVIPGVRGGVCMLFALVAGVMAPGIAPEKLPMDDPAGGVRGSFGVVPATAGGFVPKRGPGTTLEPGVAGPSAASGLGTKPNAPGLIPANRLGVVMVAGLVASWAVDVVLGFGAGPLSVKPIQPDDGAPGVAAVPVAKAEEGLLLTGTPFVVSSGGVLGLATVDGSAALMASSTEDSNFVIGGGVNLASAGDGDGEGALAPPSHCPNGVFGDAGRGLAEADFSPLTPSSSPPDTGAFARGELRSGRVLGLPRLLLELGDGDGEREGDGSEGVGSAAGVCVCNDAGTVDGDPGGVVVRVREVDDGSGSGSGGDVNCTLTTGLSALGVLEGERDFGKGMVVGSASEGVGTSVSSSSDSGTCSSSSCSSSSCSS